MTTKDDAPSLFALETVAPPKHRPSIDRAIERDRLHKLVDGLQQGDRCILVVQREGYMPEHLAFGEWSELDAYGVIGYARDSFLASFEGDEDE